MFKKKIPQLSKAVIRNHTSDEEIFRYYSGVIVKTGYKFKSPLRKDKIPTCNFFYTGSGILYLIDHSGHFSGNCFDFVMKMYNVSLKEALKIIASDFGIIAEKITVPPKVKYNNISVQAKTKLQYASRKWNKQDVDYWGSYKIPIGLLNKAKVHPAQNIWINGNWSYSYRKSDPAYIYDFGNGNIKVYFPLRKDKRFLCNTDILQGWSILPKKGEILIITKSYKDVLVLHQLGYPSVAPQSETQMISKKQFEYFSKRFKTIYSLYDFDLTGVRTANKMKKNYGIKPLFFTNGRFGTQDMGSKDVSDAIQQKNNKETLISRFKD
jgi:hypothetical protein